MKLLPNYLGRFKVIYATQDTLTVDKHGMYNTVYIDKAKLEPHYIQGNDGTNQDRGTQYACNRNKKDEPTKSAHIIRELLVQHIAKKRRNRQKDEICMLFVVRLWSISS